MHKCEKKTVGGMTTFHVVGPFLRACYARIQLFPQARGHWEAARRMRVQTGTRDEPVTWRLRWAKKRRP